MKKEIEHHPIFQKGQLAGYPLNNRTVVAPMSRISATLNGMATAAMANYYAAFARGGFSIIITEGIYTDNLASQGYHNQPGITNDEQVNAWCKVVDQVKQHKTIIIAQLMHAGALSQALSDTQAPSAVQPAGVKMVHFGGEGAFPLPRAMNMHDIQLAQKGYLQSAISAFNAGFNGIEIHAANGYLPDQFLTTHTNLRNDQYGGNVTNRYRFIAEIITAIRKVVPPSFIIGLRLSEGKVNDLCYRWPEGATAAIELLNEIKHTPLDYIHIAVQSGEWERDSLYDDGNSLARLARNTTGIPVIANGGLHDLVKAAKVLQEGHADLIAIGKAALADPEWPVRTLKGIPVNPVKSFKIQL